MLRFSCILLLALSAFNLQATPLPVEYFGQLPDISHMTLSPDGNKLAAAIRIDVDETQGIGIQVTDLAEGKQDIVLFTNNEKYFINWVRWKDGRTLLVGTYYPSQRDTWLGMGQARFSTREGRLLIIDTQTGEVKTPFPRSFLRRFRILPPALDNIVDILPDDPNHILMALPSVEGGPYNVVYRVNINNQRRTTVQNSQNNIMGWSTDRQHRIRVGHYHKDGINQTHVLDLNTEKWLELWPYETFSENRVSFAGFDHDPDIFYIRAYHEGRLALFRVNLKDPELKRELVLSHPFYDVSGHLVYSGKTKQVVGISNADEGGTLFFNDELQNLQDSLNRAMPNTKNYIFSLSDDLQKYLVYSTSDIDSGSYFLGQRSPAKIEAVSFRYNQLTPDKMSPVTRYLYKARDGLEIDAWLTLPKNSDGKNLPAIMFPHGGPHARDSDAFDVWAQFFANKGYAVLQMNFRGSDGQGVEFRNAGLQNWGQEMQDDIEDGARQLIKDGIINADRICIAGASYGGYAALMGVVKTPDFYQCSISVNGVSNVFELVRDNRVFWRSYNVVDHQIGRLGGHLRDISPVNHADKVKVPVLLIHGELDRQVDIKHSAQMDSALQQADKSVIYITLPNEDHYLSNEEQRLRTFRAIDSFLDEHLPTANDTL